MCLKKNDIIIPEGEEESSSDEDDEDDSDEDDSDSEDSDGGDNGVDDRIAEETSVVGGIEAEATKTESRKKGVATEELASVMELGKGEPEGLDVCLVISSRLLSRSYRSLQNDLRSQATLFMGVSKDMTRSAEDIQSTPLPGETLAMFYARSRKFRLPTKTAEQTIILEIRGVLDSKSRWK